jgi:hypothetical protein
MGVAAPHTDRDRRCRHPWPAVHDWFVELADNADDLESSIRILLLERHADPSGGWWELAFGRGGWDAQALRHLLDPPDRGVLLPALVGPEERRKILAAIIERAGTRFVRRCRGQTLHSTVGLQISAGAASRYF